MCVFSHLVVSDSLWPPWTVAHQAPLSVGFSQQEHWNGLPFPRLGVFLAQGLNLHLLHCRKILDRLSCFANELDFEPVQVHLLEEPFITNCSGYLEQLVNQKWGCRSHFHKSKPWMCAILVSSPRLKTWLLGSNHRLCSEDSHPYTEERQTCAYLVLSVAES